MNSKAIVIGTSAGGVEALKVVLDGLDEKINAPVIIVIHFSADIEGLLRIYANHTPLILKEAEDNENIAEKGYIYFAPPGYHLSVEDNYTFSLSLEEKVNYSRPSIDVLFESASEIYKDGLVGILLTGANNDGARGLKRIEELGGKVIVQCPNEAYIDIMPLAGIKEASSATVMKLSSINEYIKEGRV